MYVLLARLRDFSGSLVYMMRPSYFYDMGLDVLWASVEFQVACISMWVGKHTIMCRYGMLCFSMRSHPSCLLASPACRARYLSGDHEAPPVHRPIPQNEKLGRDGGKRNMH